MLPAVASRGSVHHGAGGEVEVVWGVTEQDSPRQDRKRRERPPQVSPLFLIPSEPSVYGMGFRAALPLIQACLFLDKPSQTHPEKYFTNLLDVSPSCQVGSQDSPPWLGRCLFGKVLPHGHDLHWDFQHHARSLAGKYRLSERD